jgi:hypothetical protein
MLCHDIGDRLSWHVNFRAPQREVEEKHEAASRKAA